LKSFYRKVEEVEEVKDGKEEKEKKLTTDYTDGHGI
jgi:hypothetical protein